VAYYEPAFGLHCPEVGKIALLQTVNDRDCCHYYTLAPIAVALRDPARVVPVICLMVFFGTFSCEPKSVSQPVVYAIKYRIALVILVALRVRRVQLLKHLGYLGFPCSHAAMPAKATGIEAL
jgi:hypothetical protein